MSAGRAAVSWAAVGWAVAGWAVAGRAGRPRRFAASQVTLAGALGAHGWRAARRAVAAGADPAVRSALYRGWWADAAVALGAVVEDEGGGLLRLSRDGVRTRVWDNLVPLDDPVGLRLAGSRVRAHQALSSAGVRVPRHVVCASSDPGPAGRLLDAVGTCVVKPAADTGAGTAVTCGVADRDDLRAALVYAGRWGGQVVVEEQAVGVEHRVLVLDGVVLGVVRRRPPELTGDGRSSVAQLVVEENVRRRRSGGTLGLFPLTLDLDAVATQRRAGRTLRSTVADGATFTVKTAVNEGGPAQNTGLAEAPDQLGALAIQAAAALGLRLAAVEIVAPPDGHDPVVLEVNSTPGLHYHYQVADDSYVAPVCRPLLQTLLSPEEVP